MRWVHFPLHPETPAEGQSLAELFKGRGDPEKMHARMKALMDAEGLPYERRTHTYNSRLAQELGAWAEGMFLDQQMTCPRLIAETGWQPKITDFRASDLLTE